MCVFMSITIFTLQMASAPEPTSHYTEDSLQLPIQDVHCSKLSLRMAARQYGILKSILSLYVSGKLQIGARRGPASILPPEEEQRIVDYAVHMGKIGYGRTHEQIFDIVAAIVSKDGRPNPFVNGRPGRKWWPLFRKRQPEITLRTPEKLQLARAKCCTPEILGAWFKEFGEFLEAHSSHIDIHTSKFCRENNIILYCLPPHSSHLTQPLDVSFFKPLKSAWGKACNSYCATNPGFQVTKHKFAQVLHEAWVPSTRMSTIVNGFREAGICPYKPEVVLKSKLLPSLQFSSEKSTLEAQKSTAAQSTQLNPVTVFESLIGEEKVKKFEERFEEKS